MPDPPADPGAGRATNATLNDAGQSTLNWYRMGVTGACHLLTPSTPLAYSQVFSRAFALFRVPKSSVSAGHLQFRSGFDSRQLHL
jgi:hypothetical protein